MRLEKSSPQPSKHLVYTKIQYVYKLQYCLPALYNRIDGGVFENMVVKLPIFKNKKL